MLSWITERRLIWSGGDQECQERWRQPSKDWLKAESKLTCVAFLQNMEGESATGVTFPLVPMQRLWRCFRHWPLDSGPEVLREAHFLSRGTRRKVQRRRVGQSVPCDRCSALSLWEQIPAPSLLRLPSHTPVRFGVRPRMLTKQYEVSRTDSSLSQTAVEKLTVAGFKHLTILRNHASEREREIGQCNIIYII